MDFVRSNVSKGAVILACAVCFLAGGVLVPQFVSATVSSGERDAFFPVPPFRVLDTRVGPSPLPVGTQIGGGQTVDVPVGNVGLVPATAGGVVLNVTATGATAGSLLIVFPAGTPRPTASSLNFGPGQTIANSVTVKLPASGKVSIFNAAGTVDVVADVNGYYENHTFDDRYYLKAQTDTRISTAITTPDHVTGAQVADNSLTGADVADGSLTLGDLTGSGSFLQLPLGNLNVLGGKCNVVSVNLSAANAFKVLFPMRIANGVSGAESLSASPVVLNGSGVAALSICNSSSLTFANTFNTLEYSLS